MAMSRTSQQLCCLKSSFSMIAIAQSARADALTVRSIMMLRHAGHVFILQECLWHHVALPRACQAGASELQSVGRPLTSCRLSRQSMPRALIRAEAAALHIAASECVAWTSSSCITARLISSGTNGKTSPCPHPQSNTMPQSWLLQSHSLGQVRGYSPGLVLIL